MADVLRTPDERFEEIDDWPQPPRYLDTLDLRGATLDFIPGASHFVACERGAEVARRMLARF
jgi:pimeloyl-ACP methyl ester carboxylesterase